MNEQIKFINVSCYLTISVDSEAKSYNLTEDS